MASECAGHPLLTPLARGPILGWLYTDNPERDTMPSTDHDVSDQIADTLGCNEREFDVLAITADIVQRYGVVDIDSIEQSEYWNIVFQHTKSNIGRYSAQYWVAGSGMTSAFNDYASAVQWLNNGAEQDILEPIRVVDRATGQVTATWEKW